MDGALSLYPGDDGAAEDGRLCASLLFGLFLFGCLLNVNRFPILLKFPLTIFQQKDTNNASIKRQH